MNCFSNSELKNVRQVLPVRCLEGLEHTGSTETMQGDVAPGPDSLSPTAGADPDDQPSFFFDSRLQGHLVAVTGGERIASVTRRDRDARERG